MKSVASLPAWQRWALYAFAALVALILALSLLPGEWIVGALVLGTALGMLRGLKWLMGDYGARR